MNVEVFKKNVHWNIEQVAVQFGHAEKVNTRARSGYYKSAIMLAAAIVEALAYKILEQNSNREMPIEDLQCVRSHPLPHRYKSVDNELLSICERIRPKFKLTKQTDFRKVNQVCFDLKIFSKSLFKRIDKVRTLRNKIHIQGLSNLDRSYTKHELELVSSVMNELLDKVNLIN